MYNKTVVYFIVYVYYHGTSVRYQSLINPKMATIKIMFDKHCARLCHHDTCLDRGLCSGCL